MTWDVFVQALGWAGSALLVISLLQARVLRFRILNTIGCLVLIVFNALLSVWPMVAVNAVLAGINLWFIAKLLSQRHDAVAYQVIPVAPDDAWLAYLLTRHAEDIARFQPGFGWDPGTERAAFLVVRGDETVGIVAVHDAGDGVAQVDLDYVTPRFRDFTPGEFVFRRSGLFADLGFHTVLTPPDMVDPYYARLGFARDGDRFSLTLP